MIEVGTRLCSVSADAGLAAARVECDAVRRQLAAEPTEGFAYIRGFFADSWALLGNAYRALAARAQGAGERDLLAARACFEASRDILQGLARESELPDDSAARLREVTAALEQLPARSASTPASPGR